MLDIALFRMNVWCKKSEQGGRGFVSGKVRTHLLGQLFDLRSVWNDILFFKHLCKRPTFWASRLSSFHRLTSSGIDVMPQPFLHQSVCGWYCQWNPSPIFWMITLVMNLLVLQVEKHDWFDCLCLHDFSFTPNHLCLQRLLFFWAALIMLDL